MLRRVRAQGVLQEDKLRTVPGKGQQGRKPVFLQPLQLPEENVSENAVKASGVIMLGIALRRRDEGVQGGAQVRQLLRHSAPGRDGA